MHQFVSPTLSIIDDITKLKAKELNKISMMQYMKESIMNQNILLFIIQKN